MKRKEDGGIGWKRDTSLWESLGRFRKKRSPQSFRVNGKDGSGEKCIAVTGWFLFRGKSEHECQVEDHRFDPHNMLVYDYVRNSFSCKRGSSFFVSLHFISNFQHHWINTQVNIGV